MLAAIEGGGAGGRGRALPGRPWTNGGRARFGVMSPGQRLSRREGRRADTAPALSCMSFAYWEAFHTAARRRLAARGRAEGALMSQERPPVIRRGAARRGRIDSAARQDRLPPVIRRGAVRRDRIDSRRLSGEARRSATESTPTGPDGAPTLSGSQIGRAARTAGHTPPVGGSSRGVKLRWLQFMPLVALSHQKESLARF